MTGHTHQNHEIVKAGLKKLVPEEAKEAIEYSIRAKRLRSGAIEPIEMHRSMVHVHLITLLAHSSAVTSGAWREDNRKTNSTRRPSRRAHLFKLMVRPW